MTFACHSSSGLSARFDTNVVAIGRATWEALQLPSFYLSYDWLDARSDTVAGQHRIVSVVDGRGEMKVATPAFTINRASHPGYDPIALLTADDWRMSQSADSTAHMGASAAQAALERRHDSLLPALVMAAPGRSGGVARASGQTSAAYRAALEIAAGTVEEASRHEACPTVAWLYVPDGVDSDLDVVLLHRHFSRVVIGAECHLPLRWGTFESYLDHLKAPRRRSVKLEIAALRAAGVQIEVHHGTMLGPELAPLELQWREKYGRRVELAQIVLQHEALSRTLRSAMHVFIARHNRRAVGFTVFFERDCVWYARFGGFDYGLGKLPLYFNLLFYAPIAEALHRGVRSIRYSLESYDAKRSRGCLLQNLLAYVRFRPGKGLERIGDGLGAIDDLRRARFAMLATAHAKHADAAPTRGTA